MNKIQRHLLCIYSLLTITVLILEHFWAASNYLRIYKTLIIISLFIISLMITRKFLIQKLLVYAIFFTAIGDCLFAVSSSTNNFIGQGLFAFFNAYILLIIVFRQKVLPEKSELLAAFPVALFTGFYYLYLIPYISPELRPYTLLPAAGLALVCWCGICTILQRVYTKRPAFLFAAAGCLILVSDCAISAGVFLPWYHNNPWMLNLIWATFISAWTLIAVVTAETKLFKGE